MKNTLTALTTLVLSVTMTAGMAQTAATTGHIPKASHRPRQSSKTPSVEKQIKDMRDQLRAEMQSQINELKLELSNSIAQLQVAQQHAAAANPAAAQAQQQQQQTVENIAESQTSRKQSQSSRSAASLENSQYQFSGSNAPSNFFFGEPGLPAGLFNPDTNYTNQVVPDVIVKAALDPSYGHYEVGGILRFSAAATIPTSRHPRGPKTIPRQVADLA